MKSRRWDVRYSRGFTIVELLIVVVAIAILAAITIVAFNGIQQQAKQSALLQEHAQLERDIMTHALQQNGETIAIGGQLAGFLGGSGSAQLSKPLVGTPNITMYVVYSVINRSGNYTGFAMLGPSVVSSSNFRFQAGATDGTSMGYRLDTTDDTNLSSSTANLRTPGQTIIGWISVGGNMTMRSYGYNSAAAFHEVSMTPGAGWNFTSIEAPVKTDGVVRAVLVFNAPHDQATRAQVMSWLAKKYNVAL